MDDRKNTAKYRKAVDLATQLADMPETDVEPEDVRGWQPHDLYDWLAELDYDWQGESWAYEGAI